MTETEIQEWADKFVASPAAEAFEMFSKLGHDPDLAKTLVNATSTCGKKVADHFKEVALEHMKSKVFTK